jgi:hypothetical protein
VDITYGGVAYAQRRLVILGNARQRREAYENSATMLRP